MSHERIRFASSPTVLRFQLMDGATFWTAVGSVGTLLGAWIAFLAYRESRRAGKHVAKPDLAPPKAPPPPTGGQPSAASKPRPQVPLAARVSLSSASGAVVGWISPREQTEFLRVIGAACAAAGVSPQAEPGHGQQTGVYLRLPGRLMVKFYVPKQSGTETQLKKPLVAALKLKGDIGPAGGSNDLLHEQQYAAAGTTAPTIYEL